MKTIAKGFLTVRVQKAMNLGVSVSTFVDVTVHDPQRRPNPNITALSSTELNERCPKYNFETDFVDISADSEVTITLYEHPGLMNNLGRLPFFKASKPKKIGFVLFSVAEVAEMGSLRGAYPLREAETGELHVSFSWMELSLSRTNNNANQDIPPPSS